jgi:hypothetical protein
LAIAVHFNANASSSSSLPLLLRERNPADAARSNWMRKTVLCLLS